MASYTYKGIVWLYPGLGGWHFVTLDKKLSKTIHKSHPKGMVKITATIGRTSWQTSLFPQTKMGFSYLLCIKKSVRKAEDILMGDEVRVKFVID